MNHDVSRRAARFCLSASPIALAAALLAGGISSATAATPCSLSMPSTWTLGGSGDWYTPSNWTPAGSPNSASTNVCIVDGTSTVTLNGSASVASLQLASGNGLVIGDTLTVFGSSLKNAGTITLPDTTLSIAGDTTLTGGGTVQMSSNAYFNQNSGGLTLHNVDNTIEGAGQLGQNGLSIDNQSGGTVLANVAGGTLSINGGGSVTNAGLLAASNSGTLSITNSVANAGGAITANGGTVTIDNNATISGGMLNSLNGGTLNGANTTLKDVTLSGGSTFNDTGTTYLQGTFNNLGTVVVPDTNLTVSGGDVTLKGGGTVQMSSNAYFDENDSGLTLHNVDNTIEGTGQLGQNGLSIDNQSGGTVLANVAGGTLSINGGGNVANKGLLAASNSGTLAIANNVDNTSGVITANGGTVSISSTITGGTLTTSNGGTMNGPSATLNGLTLSSGSTFTDTGTTYLEGTIANKGTITVPDANLTVSGGDVTLTGGGTVQMSSNAYFNQNSGGLTLHNVDNTIEGTGQLGQNGLSIDNQSGGKILANVSGGTLSLNGGGSVTNEGTLSVASGSSMVVYGDTNGLVQKQGSGAAPLTQVDGTLQTPNGFNLQAGLLGGSGTVIGNVVNSGGAVSPGTYILTLQGNYTQQSEGAFDVLLAGLTPGIGYTQFDITGSASLDGSLDITKAANFSLLTGDVFSIMLFGSFDGNFSDYSYNGASCAFASDMLSCANGVKFSESFSDNTLDLVVDSAGNSVSSVPLPASAPLFGAAVLALCIAGYGAKRRRADAS